MNYIDIIILALIAYAIFRGISRGFVLQFVSLLALIAGIFGALKLSGFAARYLEKHWAFNYEYLYITSLVITFILVFILIIMLGKLLDTLIKASPLSFINRLAGAIFSICKVMLITGVLLLFLERINNAVKILPDVAKEGSFFYKPLTSATRFLFPALGRHSSAEDNKHEEFV
jgi:membrane protein required for colicin V production